MTVTTATNGKNFWREITLPRDYLEREGKIIHLEDTEEERKKDLEYMKKEYHGLIVWQEEKELDKPNKSGLKGEKNGI